MQTHHENVLALTEPDEPRAQRAGLTQIELMSGDFVDADGESCIGSSGRQALQIVAFEHEHRVGAHGLPRHHAIVEEPCPQDLVSFDDRLECALQCARIERPTHSQDSRQVVSSEPGL